MNEQWDEVAAKEAGTLSARGLLAVTQVMLWAFGAEIMMHIHPLHFRHTFENCL